MMVKLRVYSCNSLTLFLTILLLGGSLAAMDWPLPDAVMVRNFGFNDRGRPALGTVFEGEGPICAAEEGEVIFSSSGRELASRLPSPLGVWTAIDHGDGLVSVYGRYNDEGKPRQFSRVGRGVPIATAGSSGWSRRDGFYFMLYDRKERRWVNTSMVITPFTDTVPPQIL
jgi:murein DD-endopeptidase MepM/ murein hydrolase activator NlpD